MSHAVLNEKPLAEGKTKELWQSRLAQEVDVYSKDDITAGNGKRHDILPGKGVLATRTTCNVFEFLQEHGVPLAYAGRSDQPRVFRAQFTRMIPLEVVGRLRAAGSFLQRNQQFTAGFYMPEVIVEYFLKTTDKVFHGRGGGDRAYLVSVNDPLVMAQQGKVHVHRPDMPLKRDEPMLILPTAELGVMLTQFCHLHTVAKRVGELLERAFLEVGAELTDFKVEFGFLPGMPERIVIADVLDNDSWRLKYEGREVSKQNYRDGADLDSVLRDYELVADLTDRFKGLKIKVE